MGEHPLMMERAEMVSSGRVSTMVIGRTTQSGLPYRLSPLSTFQAHKQGSRDGKGNKSNFSRWHHTRIHQIGSGSECD